MESHKLAEECWIKFEFSRRKFVDSRTVTEEKRRLIKREHLEAAIRMAMKNLNISLIPNYIIIILAIILPLGLQCKSSPSFSTSSLNYQQDQEQVSSLAVRPLRQAHFAEPEEGENYQTVAVGRPVKFKCVVNDIGDHKVSIRKQQVAKQLL